jgi:plastocyanin
MGGSRLAMVLAAAVGAASVGAAGRGLSQGAAAGAIRGRVIVADAPVVPRPSVSDLSAPRHGPVDRRTAVVYLDSAPRRAFDDLRPGRVRMDQRSEQFVPRVLAITAGTIVDFPNSDVTFHNVFSLSRVRTFDLGRYPPGRSGSVRFDRPGIVPVSCDIHSHMSAYILVFGHPFFAVTSASGDYSIPGVPAGTYTVRVWSELGETSPRRVAVAEGGTAEANFQVGRGGS